MTGAELMASAAAPWRDIIRNVTADELQAQTPCGEYDLRALVNHLLFWGPSLEAAARKESVAPPAQAEVDVDLTRSDWAVALDGHLERTVSAWSEPGAWEGVTHMGPLELPASLVGGMVLGELVVHGWDLARAIGQHPVWDDEVLSYTHGEVARSAEQGREMGIYGPEVAVPASSPTLDRVLGLTGRDPCWTPPSHTPAGMANLSR